jgi:hypothetical protein
METEHLGIARIRTLIWAMAVGGAIGLGIWRGWTWSAGWLVGAVISAWNFRWLKQLAQGLGTDQAKPRKAVFLGLRWLLLGAGLYVILEYSGISLPAALAGLLVSTAAVIFELLFELMYA